MLLIAPLSVTREIQEAAERESVGTTLVVVPLDYGNGIYYFAATGACFVNPLAKFLGEHPGAEVMAMTGDGDRGYGRNHGHFVVIRLKPEKE